MKARKRRRLEPEKEGRKEGKHLTTKSLRCHLLPVLLLALCDSCCRLNVTSTTDKEARVFTIVSIHDNQPSKQINAPCRHIQSGFSTLNERVSATKAELAFG